MCGMQRTTVSPSSSSTRRNTPCVAGCWGPMLISMCSPSRSGSRAWGGATVTRLPASSTASGTRTGRPWASKPLVESATSIVRVLLIAYCSSRVAHRVLLIGCPCLLARLLAALQAGAHRRRQVLECIGNRQLLHRVPGFGIRGQRLPELLRPAEAAAQRKILPQREAFEVLLPHQDTPQVRVAAESNAEHVITLALQPIRAL